MNSGLQAPREPTLLTFSVSGAFRGLIIFMGWTLVCKSPQDTHLLAFPPRERGQRSPSPQPSRARSPTSYTAGSSWAGDSGEEGEHDGKGPSCGKSAGLWATWGLLPKLLKFIWVSRC